jgi:hypothetical protein
VEIDRSVRPSVIQNPQFPVALVGNDVNLHRIPNHQVEPATCSSLSSLALSLSLSFGIFLALPALAAEACLPSAAIDFKRNSLYYPLEKLHHTQKLTRFNAPE